MLNNQPLPELLPPLEGAGERDRAVVSTLLYFDLFSFPPSAAELVRFAHRAGADGHLTNASLSVDSPWWSSKDGYWFLKGREHLITHRSQLIQPSAAKVKQVRRWARLFQLMPGVRFVGITGSLSMASAVPEDDIDVLVITAPRRLWLTRALVLGALWSGGVKRADDGRSEHPNQICANIFLSEDNLEIPDHNLFIAHEICQTLPLLGPAAYSRFLAANAWVCDYLPQWEPAAPQWEDRPAMRFLQRIFETAFLGPVGARLEAEFARRQLARIQEKHARGHNVGIKLSPTQLRFHPRDLSDYVIGAFNARWDEMNSRERKQEGTA